MPRPTNPTPEEEAKSTIDRLIVSLRHGELSSSEQKELENLVCSNPAARRRYIRWMALSASLEWNAGQDGGKEPTTGTPRAAGANGINAVAPHSSITDLPVGGSPAGNATEMRRYFPLFPELRGLGMLGAFLTVLFVALGIVFWMSGRATQHGGKEIGEHIVASGEGVTASFRRTVVQLDKGVTHVSLAGVGKVAVEGPVELELLDPLRARLNYGRMRMLVSEKSGRGYTVETPHGNVIDIGTEFALHVERRDTKLVVFQGEADLQMSDDFGDGEKLPLQRFFVGEGVRFAADGQIGRIMSLVSVGSATFQSSADEIEKSDCTIVSVSDNLQTSDTKKFYEIVPHGLREDAVAYVDRPKYQWNGMTKDGMPSYLIGADYVKTFNESKASRDTWIEITLAGPATLYLFFDARVSCPKWLEDDFEGTGDQIGLDAGNPKGHQLNAVGPGISIDGAYDIYKYRHAIKQAGTVKLGPNYLNNQPIHTRIAMYGIAAVPLKPEVTPTKQ